MSSRGERWKHLHNVQFSNTSYGYVTIFIAFYRGRSFASYRERSYNFFQRSGTEPELKETLLKISSVFWRSVSRRKPLAYWSLVVLKPYIRPFFSTSKFLNAALFTEVAS